MVKTSSPLPPAFPESWLLKDRGGTIARLSRSLTLTGGLLAITALVTLAQLKKLPPALAVPAPISPPAAKQAQPPAGPPLPDAVPAPIQPDETGIVSLAPAPGGGTGVGLLRPMDLSSLSTANWPNSPLLHADWLRGVALPIYPSPDSPPWGWLINGWLIPNGTAPLAIGRDAAFSMVPIDRHIYTFPVLEIRPDGWFRFQYTPAGSAWAHTAHLSLGSIALTVETWEDYMADATRVEFRRPGLSQPMRRAPSDIAPLQALVGANSIIQPLAMEGDWLQVRVTQPAQGCVPLPGAIVEEGWVLWRDDFDNPLVRLPDRGC